MKKFKSYVAELKVDTPKSGDTLGLTRDKMPQVKSKDYDDLIKHLKKNGIRGVGKRFLRFFSAKP